MAKSKAPSILEVIAEIKKRKFKPVYYFFGEDSYNLSSTLYTLEESFKPLLLSEFDKETIYSEDRSINDILGLATAFPFGSEKKLIIVKDAEKIKDKKNNIFNNLYIIKIQNLFTKVTIYIYIDN